MGSEMCIRDRATDSSILNILPARIESLLDEGSGTVMLRLALGAEAHVLARVTQRSVAQLRLCAGMPVFAQVKGVALLG